MFKTGHCGVYIGNDTIIEAMGHKYGVVQTNLNSGKWSKWGKLDWIDYNTTSEKFSDGDELNAINFLVSKGRLYEKEYWINKLPEVNNLKWIFIKWANDLI